MEKQRALFLEYVVIYFDWQLRQVIETNFNKFIFNNLTVPDVSDEIYEEISKYRDFKL